MAANERSESATPTRLRLRHTCAAQLCNSVLKLTLLVINNTLGTHIMTIFSDLCSIAADDKITLEVATIIDKAIKETNRGKLCLSLIYQYNAGLITFAKFRNSFIAVASSPKTESPEQLP